MVAKVRHGLVRVALDVPDDEVLAAWGTAARKPLAGHVTFFETDRRTARETLRWAAGECVGYHGVFVSGDGGGLRVPTGASSSSPAYSLLCSGI